MPVLVANVRFGQRTDGCAGSLRPTRFSLELISDVRSTPESGRHRSRQRCWLSANSGHWKFDHECIATRSVLGLKPQGALSNALIPPRINTRIMCKTWATCPSDV